MQDYKIGSELIKLIDSQFFGGLGNFYDEGYQFAVVSLPNEATEVFLYVPDNKNNPKLLHALKDYGRKHKHPVRLVDSLNFEGITPADLTRESIEPLLIAGQVLVSSKVSKITYTLGAVISSFELHGVVDDKELMLFKEALEKIPFLVRAVVIYDEMAIRIDKRVPKKVVVKAAPLQHVTQDNIRQTVIGQDDITNLKIALESADDIDTFLKLM